MFYKMIIGDYIVGVTTHESKFSVEITETEYNELLSIIDNKPTPQTGFDYRLTTDRAWELVELPPIDDTDDEATESDYIDALQDLGVDVDA